MCENALKFQVCENALELHTGAPGMLQYNTKKHRMSDPSVCAWSSNSGNCWWAISTARQRQPPLALPLPLLPLLLPMLLVLPPPQLP